MKSCYSKNTKFNSLIRCASAFLIFALFAVHVQTASAKTVTLTGSMQSTLTFSKRLVAHVPKGLSSVTINVPLATSIVGYGWGQTFSDIFVRSSLQPSTVRDLTDSYGNHYKALVYDCPAAGDIVVTTSIPNITVEANLSNSVPSVAFPLTGVPADMAVYLKPSTNVQCDSPEVQDAAQSIIDGAGDEGTAAQRLAAWMFQNVTYASGSYIPTIDAKWTLVHRMGQCAGWANLFVALARSSGIPARVVTGYTLGGSLTYPISRDSLDSVTVTSFNMPHSWVEIWYPAAGWIPYEPQSSSAFVDSHHLCFHTSPTADSTKPILEWSFPAGVSANVTYNETYAVSNMTDKLAVNYAGEDTATDDRILLARSLP